MFNPVVFPVDAPPKSKRLKPGSKLFIDSPVTDSNKKIFDGVFFLAYRSVFIVQEGSHQARVQEKWIIKENISWSETRKVKIRPDIIISGIPFYSKWGKRQPID